jgi:putative membrane protein
MSSDPSDEGPVVGPPEVPAEDPTPWSRLDRRVIAVDAVQVLASLAFGLLAGRVLPESGGMFPVATVVAVGVVTALADAYRWVVTWYRVTPEHVERRRGVLVRSHRSVRRDRIRSVDVHAKLRHRIAGLRVVRIGAGQQAAAGESAFDLDAVSVAQAEVLRNLLLERRGVVAAESVEPVSIETESVEAGPGDTVASATPLAHDLAPVEVLARLQPRWVLYNVLNLWGYVLAVGLLWGGYWFLSALGATPGSFVGGIVDWERLGVGVTVAVAFVALTLIGVVGLAVYFFVEYWDFELARVPTDDGRTALRTRHGLFTTREVSRDERRMRGVQISEPLLWRWLGMADTRVITTGLSMSATSQPSTILPRGPISVARPVTARVVSATANPLEAELIDHPPAALRRRLTWASALVAVVAASLVWLVTTDVLPAWTLWSVLAVTPLALGAAVIAYRALGHAVAGEHLVVRSGLTSRTTTALRRSAVSTIAIRQSVLQRRLGLTTVGAMTSAGHGGYDAYDLDAAEAITFAAAAAPGLLEEFLVADASGDGRRTTNAAGAS